MAKGLLSTAPPIEGASSSSEESAPVKVTVCGAQRCWKRSKVLGGQTSTWQPQKRGIEVGQSLHYKNSGKLLFNLFCLLGGYYLSNII